MHIPCATSLPNPSIANNITNSSALNRSQSSSDLSETDIDHIESSLMAAVRPNAVMISGKDVVGLLEDNVKCLDEYNSDAMSEIPHDSREVVEALERLATQGPGHRNERSNSCTSVQSLAQDAEAFLGKRQTLCGVPLSQGERTIALMDFAGRIINNDFEGDLGRWAANGLNAGIRTGIIVSLTTLLRQFIGFELEKALLLGDVSMPNREVIGAAAMLLGPGLNIAGFVRDERNHTATAHSRTARVGMFALSVGTLVAASQTGEPATLGSLMSSFGIQTASYTLARDLAQLFFPLRDNAPMNLIGALAGTASYSGVQFGVGEAMDALAPSSGAGRVMAAAAARPPANDAATTLGSTASSSNAKSISDRIRSAVSSLQPDWAQDVTRGILNAVAEISDDLVRPGISRALHVSQTQAAARRQALAEGRDPEATVAALPKEETDGLRVRLEARIPNLTQVADQFLTTGAMRLSAFENIMGTAMSVATALAQTNLSSANQGHLINAVVAANVAVIYPLFLYSHQQRTSEEPAEVNSQNVNIPQHPQEMELRRRHIR